MGSCSQTYLQTVSLARFLKLSSLIFLILLVESPVKSWAAPNKSPVDFKSWDVLDKSPVASESRNSAHYSLQDGNNDVRKQPDLFENSPSSHEAERTPITINGVISMILIIVDICIFAAIVWLCTAFNELRKEEKALALSKQSAAPRQNTAVSKNNEYVHYPFKHFVTMTPVQQSHFAPN